MRNKEERSRRFKDLRVTIFVEDQVGVAFNAVDGQFASLSIFKKPRKVARQLRRIAAWLDKEK